MKINPSIVSIGSEAIDTLKYYERPRSDVKIEIDYVNNLGVDIVVLDRRGIEFIIPCRFNPSAKQLNFKIYEMLYLQEGVRLNFNEHERDEDMIAQQQHFLDSLHMDSKAERNSRKTLVCTTVKITDLRDNNNCLYLKEYDVVIYIPRPGFTVIHPVTVSKALKGMNLSKEKVNDFEFNIRINDPNNKIGDRFINISGMIYRITPSRDTTQMEGVVITTSSAELDGEFVHVPMSIEDFEANIKTYKSFEEAKTFGDLEATTKKAAEAKLDELKHSNLVQLETLKQAGIEKQAELDQAKIQLQSATQDFKQKEIEHKKQLEALQLEIDKEKHVMELQSLQRKSYYEERSYDRKDSSELIKFLPAIIGAGIVLLFKS